LNALSRFYQKKVKTHMAEIFWLPRFIEKKGSLTVLDNLEELLPFPVKRVFFINAVTDEVRGGHRHHATRQAVICIQGSCIVANHDGRYQQDFILDTPDKCLILETNDWHAMHSFTHNAVLLVFASKSFDPEDYIYEPYKEVVNDTIRKFASG
jgi:dTDP-4-dehydrorhamnose 3,5-epimerase-like enzyme